MTSHSVTPPNEKAKPVTYGHHLKGLRALCSESASLWQRALAASRIVDLPELPEPPPWKSKGGGGLFYFPWGVVRGCVSGVVDNVLAPKMEPGEAAESAEVSVPQMKQARVVDVNGCPWLKSEGEAGHLTLQDACKIARVGDRAIQERILVEVEKRVMKYGMKYVEYYSVDRAIADVRNTLTAEERFNPSQLLLTCESEWQQLVEDAAIAHGWLVHHSFMSSGAGFPDLVLLKRGKLLFVELKIDNGKVENEVQLLSAQQWVWGQKLLNAGHHWDIWLPINWENIQHVLRG